MSSRVYRKLKATRKNTRYSLDYDFFSICPTAGIVSNTATPNAALDLLAIVQWNFAWVALKDLPGEVHVCRWMTCNEAQSGETGITC